MASGKASSEFSPALPASTLVPPFMSLPYHSGSDPVREFQGFTTDPRELSRWLKETGITSVAMESTGVYWTPVYSRSSW